MHNKVTNMNSHPIALQCVSNKFLIFCDFHSFHSFIHSFIRNLTIGTQPLPKGVLHTVQSSASSSTLPYLLFSLKSSSRCVLIISRVPVTCIFPFVFPSITCFRKQFLRQLWPIHLAFLHFTVRRIFLCSLTLCNTSSFSTWSVQLIFSILLQHHISKLPRYFWSIFRSVKISASYKAMLQI
jgi:hypothetical protein